jgi:hypothetical protein
VSVSQFAKPYTKGEGVLGMIESMPRILAGDSFRAVVEAVRRAWDLEKPILWGLGGHVVKVGLGPTLIDLMERGFVSGVAMNGSTAIHDFEVALAGSTSEDVDAVLPDGRFGMAEETGAWMNQAIVEGDAKGIGIGEALGEFLLQKVEGEVGNAREAKEAEEKQVPRFARDDKLEEEQVPRRSAPRDDRPLSPAVKFPDASILLQAYRRRIPVTVHVAIGTDTPHNHPLADGRAIGGASHRDFLLFSGMVAKLGHGGVYLNVGSAVVLPEVFLKAVTLARNLERELDYFTTVNLDFLQHYRPLENVVRRPTMGGGKGYALTGHHEILLPLLAAALVEGE